MEDHKGFKFKVVGGNIFSCTHFVSQLSITIGNYMMKIDIVVVYLGDIDIIF